MLKKEKLMIEQKEIQQDSTALIEATNNVVKASNLKKTNAKRKTKKEDVVENDRFKDLANLTNKSIDELHDEFFAFNIKKLLSTVRKVVVRYDISDKELEKTFLSCNEMYLSGLTVAPIYLNACARFAKKHNAKDMAVGTIVDFPFGESSFKGKLSSVKESLNIGADDVSVTIPNVLFLEENQKILKKQIKKLGRVYRNSVGITVNASDLDDEKLIKAVKFFVKSKLLSLTLAFGQASFAQVKEKLDIVKESCSNKKVCVLANVDSVEGVSELLKLGVDQILTPYADQIGKDLIKRFKLKNAKLR
jgi:deoxyribose-phosphate aldolase